ncbi:MAG: hypothetical protein Q609_ECAC01375G0001 [Escherichia coli DORA_A_5_14_21]|uniref:Uncharacterized protein n=1 Tax=Escherichia coli DORA_A_5_14_21 TaxID=1403943 RepID=W1X789_ECOLX|nr:MAG: hypothetical protein Q609_ECAC01375G0001 [Escherichia coli DORA_A_5_14_21]
MTRYLLMSTSINNTSIRNPAIYLLIAVIDDMSIICCTSFIYSLAAVYSLIIYNTNNIRSESRHPGRGIYHGSYQ